MFAEAPCGLFHSVPVPEECNMLEYGGVSTYSERNSVYPPGRVISCLVDLLTAFDFQEIKFEYAFGLKKNRSRGF